MSMLKVTIIMIPYMQIGVITILFICLCNIFVNDTDANQYTTVIILHP